MICNNNFIKNKIIKNTKKRSKANIAKHYDLGNDFSLWLDETLTYSSAIFENENQTLSEAQNNKYQKLINLLKPKENSKVLEIDADGEVLQNTLKKYNAKLDCITISKKQYILPKKEL